MSGELKNKAVAQLDRAIEMAQCFLDEPDLTGDFTRLFKRFATYSMVAVAEITGEQSVFSKQIEVLLNLEWSYAATAEGVVGVIEAVLAAIDAGLLSGYRKLIRGDLFSDYLDMASHLLQAGYKDASAVIVGSSLEVELRSLCNTYEIPITDVKDGKEIRKKAETLNTALRKCECYDKNTQKLVTAWLGIRNDAAHGNYDAYSEDTVRTLMMGVRSFISEGR